MTKARKKELLEIAKIIANSESIIQENQNSSEVNLAKQIITTETKKIFGIEEFIFVENEIEKFLRK